MTAVGITTRVTSCFHHGPAMHPNRATSTLFSGFLLLPAELTRLIKTGGLQNLAVNIGPKLAQGGGGRSIDVPVGRMSEKIALPPKPFFELGYRPGDPMQFRYEGGKVEITPLEDGLTGDIDDCEVDDEGVKIPPAWLIQAFTGAPDTIDHIEGGKRSADCYVKLYEDYCGDYGAVERVLDFGCGCGRVLSRMPLGGKTQYFGVDLHEQGLQWLRQTMPQGTFAPGRAMPPLDLEEESFDLIYSVSVLTHLDRTQELAWLDEWHRLLKPGGLVIATFRAEDWVEQFTIERQKRAIKHAWRENDGFCYQKHRYWEGIFPDFYSGTWQTTEYVRSNWGKRFEILTIVPPADAPNEQNTAVMRRAPDA